MRLRYLLLIILLGSLLSLSAAIFIIMRIAPTNTILAPILLSLTMFFAVSGLLSSALIWLRASGANSWRMQRNLNVSTRQGAVIGGLFIVALWMAHFDILSFWLILGLILIAAFLEYRLLPESIRNHIE